MFADDYDEPYDTTIYYCTNCKKECDVRYEDEGIGAYEYWGDKGVDEKWQAYSDCCDSYVTTEVLGEDHDT